MIILYQDGELRAFLKYLDFSALRFREPHSKSVNLVSAPAGLVKRRFNFKKLPLQRRKNYYIRSIAPKPHNRYILMLQAHRSHHHL